MFEDTARGRWVAQLKVDGQLRRRYAATQEEAWAAREQLVADARLGLASDARTLLADYLEEWVATVRVRPLTRLNYRSKVRLYLAPPPLGRVPIAQLSAQHLRRLFAEMEAKGLAPRTIRQTRAILQSALRQAQEDGLVTRNVAALVKPPAIIRSERRTLTPDEVRTFLESLRGDRLEPCYVTAAMLGLRQGELLGLRWRDIETGAAGRDVANTSTYVLDPGTPAPRILHVRQTLQRVGGAYFTGPPKTKTSTRSLPLPEVLARLLEAHRVRQKEEFLATGARPEHDLVFTTAGGNPVNGSWLTHDLQKRLAALGLPRTTFHDLRHTAASLLLAEGFGPREIMSVLGHSTIAQSMETYAHIPDATIRAKMERLDEWRAR